MSEIAPGEYEFSTSEGLLHYTVTGQGPACLVISGGPGAHPHYFEDLAGLTDTLTLVFLHPRGAGDSRFPNDADWSLTGYARDVEALRQRLGLDRPLILGHSHGGFIAMRYAIMYPTHVGPLILFDTSARGLLEWDMETAIQPYADQPWFPTARVELALEITAETTPEEAARNLQAVMPFYFAQLTPDVAAYGARVGTLPYSTAPQIYGADVNGFQTDQRPDLPSINTPTLVLVGRHDFIHNVEMAEEIARLIPGSELVIFEQSGHFAFVEERARFHAVVRDFVQRMASPVSA